MAGRAHIIETDRLRLSSWTEDDRTDFLALYADPMATQDFGRTLTAAEATANFVNYLTCQASRGYTRWKLSDPAGRFIGTTGIMHQAQHDALGTHDEIGWRMLPAFWGKGYATEAARAALTDAQTRCGVRGVLTYTGHDNIASRAVMERLDYIRAPELDYITTFPAFGTFDMKVWRVPDPS